VIARAFFDLLPEALHLGGAQHSSQALLAATLSRDCSDGMNTVSLVLKNGGSQRAPLRWLWADAIAPTLGAAISLFIRPTVIRRACACAGRVRRLFPLHRRQRSSLRKFSYPRQDAAVTLAGAATLFLIVRLAG